jgi:hypothetical protein
MVVRGEDQAIDVASPIAPCMLGCTWVGLLLVPCTTRRVIGYTDGEQPSVSTTTDFVDFPSCAVGRGATTAGLIPSSSSAVGETWVRFISSSLDTSAEEQGTTSPFPELEELKEKSSFISTPTSRRQCDQIIGGSFLANRPGKVISEAVAPRLRLVFWTTVHNALYTV